MFRIIIYLNLGYNIKCMKNKYYFTRHGQSVANVEHISAGWSDVPLTELGRSQALETEMKYTKQV